VLVPYDPAWPTRFEAYRDELLEAGGPWLEVVHHIGSTSVPGLGAKPVIDIMPGLRRYEDGLQLVEPLQARGYEYLGEYGLPGRHFFRRMKDSHVHVYTVGQGQWHDQLAFRDYLRAHDWARDAYWQLKCQLARAHDDIDDYADAKSNFVADILRRARGGR
jgi:GrpB-like predicted nucleotidyltransferase (UPF0157 family)